MNAIIKEITGPASNTRVVNYGTRNVHNIRDHEYYGVTVEIGTVTLHGTTVTVERGKSYGVIAGRMMPVWHVSTHR